MAPNVEVILSQLSFLEGPHWDTDDQCLYFVDIFEHSINKYVPSTKKLTSAVIGDQIVSIIIPIKDTKDQFLITVGRSIASVTWDGESDSVTNLQILCEVDDGTSNMLNDGKCDPSGRLWVGTLNPTSINIETIVPSRVGSLYSFENNTVRKHRENIGLSNGIAFNPDLGKMYYIDSLDGTVDQFDLDINRGNLTNPQTIFTREKHGFDKYIFDGMAIDTEGYLWVAVHMASRVIKIDPRRPETIVDAIEIPSERVTSVAFGGPNLDELWVTSGYLKEDAVGTSSGSLFRVTGINARGIPVDKVVL